MEVVKKFRKNIAILIYIFVLMILTCNCSYAKGKFIELDFKQDNYSQPVALNDYEIFFPGGSNDKFGNINSAKIYNIKEKKLTDTKSVMNIPRFDYGTIKYDDNHILIVGGLCSDNTIKRNACAKVAEIYNINENKFTRISDTNLEYTLEIKTILLKNKNVFILSGEKFELYKPDENKFMLITNGKYHREYERIVQQRGLQTNLISYTKNFYSYSNAFLLSEDEILIYGFRPLGFEPKRETFSMEIFNLKTKKFTNLPIDYNQIAYINIGVPIKINNNVILFVGAGKDKKDVLKFDIQNKNFQQLYRLSAPLSGHAILINNQFILFSNGCIKSPDLSKSTFLEHAIYNYKLNKISNYKISKDAISNIYLIKLNKTVFITASISNNPTLFKY